MAAAVTGFNDSALMLSTYERPRVETSTWDSRVSIIRSSLVAAPALVEKPVNLSASAACGLAGVSRLIQESTAAGRYCRGFRRDQNDGLRRLGLNSGSSRSFNWSITCLAMLRDCRMNSSFCTRSASGLTSATSDSTLGRRGAWTPTSTLASDTKMDGIDQATTIASPPNTTVHEAISHRCRQSLRMVSRKPCSSAAGAGRPTISAVT